MTATDRLYNNFVFYDICPECNSSDVRFNFDGTINISDKEVVEITPHSTKGIIYFCNNCHNKWEHKD
jgi:hypothetical protein